MNQEKIGKFIAKCRKDNKMTQQELAEKLNVSDRAVSNWENGKNMPDLSLFKPLCEILDISVNEFLNGGKDYDVNKNTLDIIDVASCEITKVKNKSKKKIIIILISFIVLLGIIFGITDYNKIKYGENPNFMIRITDGSKQVQYYIGLGYMMERKVGVSYKEPLISDIYVRFGILFFTWDVDVLKTSPDNLYLISENDRVQANMGSYCWSADLDDIKSSVCADTIDPIHMTYDEVLNVKANEKIFYDLKDCNITKITLYNNDNIVDYDIVYDKDTITIPNLIGNYLIVVNFKSEHGSVMYSFKINISE